MDDIGNNPVVMVYPRWRGEHPLIAECLLTVIGLSPLARGTLFQVSNKQKRIRFIPAGAGNTGASLLI